MPGPFNPDRWLCRLGEVLDVLATKFTESEMTTIRVLLMRHFRQRYNQNEAREAPKDELHQDDPDEG